MIVEVRGKAILILREIHPGNLADALKPDEARELAGQLLKAAADVEREQ